MSRPIGVKNSKPRSDKSPVSFMQRRATSCKKYEKTLKGKLMRTYRNMESRVLGIQKKNAPLYKGLEILSREEFYAWSLSNVDYLQLFEAWVVSDFDRKLSPSIDRIDATRGYTLDNMRWVTHSQNSRETNRWANQ